MSESKVVRVEKEIGGRTLVLETGRVAKLASAAVMATYGGTTVLATVVRDKPRPGLDFFPLTVDYREKTSAAGKFPGGFRKREGAPNEKEILTMRLIDRPIRPLFADGFVDEIQIQCWVMSHDTQNDGDVLAGTAASAALALSNAPFEGPTATVRVGRIDDQFVINPTHAQLEFSDLDMVVAGHRDGINMIEVGAAETPDDDVLAGLKFAQDHIAETLDLIEDLVKQAGQEKVEGELLRVPDELMSEVTKKYGDAMLEARQISGKTERSERIDAIREQALLELAPEPDTADYRQHIQRELRFAHVKEAIRNLEKKSARKLLVEKSIRADGRDFNSVRQLEMEVGLFARTHGSSLFQRGETQALVSCTLGTTRDEQIVDGLLPEYSKKFTLHYNFPPFCVGEARRITGPGRREIGHGALAERSLVGVLPDPEEFPYTIRIVSDITESNGSSSMASVCGGCLAMMDAGVPIKNTVAGISIGRFSDDNGKVVHVTDIIGEEDFFGDMDFKICGTREGITGIQLDLKARGLDLDEITAAFKQAREARHFIIDQMEAVIEAPRDDIAPHAPRIITLKIDPDKIGKLIGPSGKTIRALQDRTGAAIDVEDDGTVYVSTADRQAAEDAKAEIEALTAEVKVGTMYTGKVVAVKDFGCFVEIAPGTDGMCHVSELDEGFVKSVGDVVKLGDEIRVKVIAVDDQGRIKLSRKQAMKTDDGKKQDESKKEKETVKS
ncbi:MAG: polyribonucleotide nucleotidyltransferase [Phycisphaerales bacterium]